jgi:hypothetical protein
MLGAQLLSTCNRLCVSSMQEHMVSHIFCVQASPCALPNLGVHLRQCYS